MENRKDPPVFSVFHFSVQLKHQQKQAVSLNVVLTTTFDGRAHLSSEPPPLPENFKSRQIKSFAFLRSTFRKYLKMACDAYLQEHPAVKTVRLRTVGALLPAICG